MNSLMILSCRDLTTLQVLSAPYLRNLSDIVHDRSCPQRAVPCLLEELLVEQTDKLLGKFISLIHHGTTESLQGQRYLDLAPIQTHMPACSNAS